MLAARKFPVTNRGVGVYNMASPSLAQPHTTYCIIKAQVWSFELHRTEPLAYLLLLLLILRSLVKGCGSNACRSIGLFLRIRLLLQQSYSTPTTKLGHPIVPRNRGEKIRANRFWNVYYLRLWFLPRRCCTIFHSLSKYFAHSTQWNCPRPGLSSSGTKALS